MIMPIDNLTALGQKMRETLLHHTQETMKEPTELSEKFETNWGAVALTNKISWSGSFIFAVFICAFRKKLRIILLFYILLRLSSRQKYTYPNWLQF